MRRNKRQSLPMKKKSNVVLHVRVPGDELKTLKKAGADIPAIVRNAITEAHRMVSA